MSKENNEKVIHIYHHKDKGDCFIVTVCYGNSYKTEIFKNWRDNRLSRNTAGKRFIDFYYRTSPTIVKFVSNKPTIIKLIRIGLLNPISKLI